MVGWLQMAVQCRSCLRESLLSSAKHWWCVRRIKMFERHVLALSGSVLVVLGHLFFHLPACVLILGTRKSFYSLTYVASELQSLGSKRYPSLRRFVAWKWSERKKKKNPPCLQYCNSVRSLVKGNVRFVVECGQWTVF